MPGILHRCHVAQDPLCTARAPACLWSVYLPACSMSLFLSVCLLLTASCTYWRWTDVTLYSRSACCFISRCQFLVSFAISEYPPFSSFLQFLGNWCECHSFKHGYWELSTLYLWRSLELFACYLWCSLELSDLYLSYGSELCTLTLAVRYINLELSALCYIGSMWVTSVVFSVCLDPAASRGDIAEHSQILPHGISLSL